MNTICRRKKKRLFIFFFLFPGMVIYTCFLLLPILDSMRLSFYSTKEDPSRLSIESDGIKKEEVQRKGLLPDKFVGFGNYKKLFTKPAFNKKLTNAFFNNIKFFFIVTFIQNIMGFFMAYVLTRKMLGMKFFRKISFIPTTISVLVVGYIFRLILNPRWGILNKLLYLIGMTDFKTMSWLGDPGTALPVLAIVVSWQFIGESILFYTAGMDAIPNEVLEAAKLDGVSPIQEIKYIILPSIMPIVGMVTILIFIGDFTQFDIVYAMATSQANPEFATDLFGSLFYRVTFFTSVRGGWGMGMGAAVSTIMFLIVFVGVVGWLALFRKKEN